MKVSRKKRRLLIVQSLNLGTLSSTSNSTLRKPKKSNKLLNTLQRNLPNGKYFGSSGLFCGCLCDLGAAQSSAAAQNKPQVQTQPFVNKCGGNKGGKYFCGGNKGGKYFCGGNKGGKYF